MSDRTTPRRLPGGRRGAAVLAAALLVGGAACVAVALPDPPAAAVAPLAVDRDSPPTTGPDPDPTPSVRPAVLVHPAAAASEPVSLSIPAIGVSAAVRSVGQNADGTVEVPVPGPHYDDVGWYRYSPTPGELGPAVLVGHVDSAANGPSVFVDLDTLEPGDTIEVTRADGTIAVFVVDEVSSFPKAAFPTQRVYGDTTNAALRVISCGGAFDRASGHYLDNVVVFASLVVPAG